MLLWLDQSCRACCKERAQVRWFIRQTSTRVHLPHAWLVPGSLCC